MYAYSARRLASFCQWSPAIFWYSEPLPCTTSSWERGRMKFSLNAYMQAEGQLVVVVAAVDRVLLEVAERVVHPAHVPLEAEAEAAQ